MPRCRVILLAVLGLLVALCTRLPAAPPDGNRLAYLDGINPYYPNRDFPRLITPQWVGEPGVEAVVVLAIDDMRDPGKYEAFLRPILSRLKAVDGRAPLSIMTNQVAPKDPRLESWLKEGLSLEVHTLTHPCPLLQKGDFALAARTYHGCVDLMNQIPGNKPVAFRMPCCDSMNSVSPRFFAEMFNKTSPGGHYLSIDSSVFMVLTPDDSALPRSLVFDRDGRERFRKYIPFPSFVNTIENYPYPYVIGGICWEFPCIVPSDWEGQNINRPNSSRTLEDMKAALDAVVLKQGVFNLVFHPHGWIRSEQVVELIDHAVRRYGKKVKFLTFKEALDRLNANLLKGHPLRDPGRAGQPGALLVDTSADGYLDLILNEQEGVRLHQWLPAEERWVESPLLPGSEGGGKDRVLSVVPNSTGVGLSFIDGVSRAVVPRLVDIDGDGATEMIPPDPDSPILPGMVSPAPGGGLPEAPRPLPFHLPPGARLLDEKGRDAGLRFVDLDDDGRLDVVFSNDQEYGVYLFDSREKGWARKLIAGKAGESGALPKIVRDGTDNGFFVHSRTLWWQNENTASLPDKVDRRTFNDLMKNVEPRGRSPEASLRSIRVAPGFKVELVAAEPLVKDPIAFDWSADGRLWVLEMGDYPLGADGKGGPGGVIRVLEDNDGDGRYDQATTFLEGLSIPAGIMAWKKGVLIACAPDIFYAEDRDGDGHSDHREVLFTGFNEGNPQHRVNGFELGLDGWVYGANGDSGGSINSIKTGKTVEIRGRDFRFRPDTGEFEAETGQTQYGRHRDDWGHWFGNNNPNWAWHFLLSDADLRRNRYFAPPDPRQTLEPETRLYPISPPQARFNDLGAANHTTSANSATSYRDDLFGPWYAANLFVSEPVHNLVHRMVLEPDGVTFRGRRGPNEASSEFLASSDNWFRPTMLKTGPDGALWIADMYRAVIEHPEWIPDEWEKRLDLRAGSEEGRIYRVYPVDQKPRPIPRLDTLDEAGLVAALDSPSGWQRDTAQRLLLHRGGLRAVEPLRTLIASTKRPQTRVQAIWTLADSGALDEASALFGITDADPRVREAVVAAVEPLLRTSSKVAASILALADDPSARVRFRLALLLGNWDDPRAGEALARLASKDGDDRWMRAAILSSAVPHLPTLLGGVLNAGRKAPAPRLAEPLLAMAGSMPGNLVSETALKSIGRPAGQGGRYAPWQYLALSGMIAARERSRNQPIDLEGEFADLWQSARRVVGDESGDLAERLAAIGLLRRSAARQDADRDRLAGLLSSRVPLAVQQAAVEGLGSLRDPAVADLLLDRWNRRTPQIRSAILDALLSRPTWTEKLLTALKDGRIPVGEIDPGRRDRLVRHADRDLRARAVALLSRPVESRQSVLDAFREAAAGNGDPARGAAFFKKICVSCHKMGSEGAEVGPDLGTLNDRSPAALLVAILDPNRAVESKYVAYTAATVDGRVLSGVIASESATSVTLKRQDGKDEVLLRSDIEDLAGTGRSLMPEGLEKDLTPRDLADLIAFVASIRPAGKGE